MHSLRFCATALLSLLLVITTACVINQKFNYRSALPDLDYAGQGKVVVAVHDQRPEVTSGDSVPSFVGRFRTESSISWHVRTLSSNPLAEDLCYLICKAMTDAGYDARPLATAPGLSAEQVGEALSAVRSDRAIVVRIDEWCSITEVDTFLTYDLDIHVLDSNRNPLSNFNIRGTEVIIGSAISPRAAAIERIPLKCKKILETFLNDRELILALSSE